MSFAMQRGKHLIKAGLPHCSPVQHTVCNAGNDGLAL